MYIEADKRSLIYIAQLMCKAIDDFEDFIAANEDLRHLIKESTVLALLRQRDRFEDELNSYPWDKPYIPA